MATKTAELEFRGGLQFETHTGSGRTLTFGDSPEEGLGPIETVLAALAACTAMDVVSIALKKRQDVTRYAVHATAEQRDDYAKVFTRIDIVHDVEGATISTDAVQRCIELSAEKYCPVSAMLSAGLTEIHHRYVIRRPGEVPEEGEVIVTGPFRSTDVVA